MGSAASKSSIGKGTPAEETKTPGDTQNDIGSSETNSQEENKQSLNTDGSTMVDSNENAQETDQPGAQITIDDGHAENNDSKGNKGKGTHGKDRVTNDTNESDKKNENDGRANDNSGVAYVEGSLILALPHQSVYIVNHDQQTQNSKQEGDKMTESQIQARQKGDKIREKQNTSIEKARKKMKILKDEHQKMVSNLKDKFHDLSIKSDVLQVTMARINSQQRSLNPKSELKLSKDEQKYEKLRELKRERGKLLHRLSEIASARLRQNNPDIADLSDENRATKLAEKLSELYDNEWTDLFEVTKENSGKKTNDRQIAENLRDILMFCYESCQGIADDQRSSFVRSLRMNHVGDQRTSNPDIQASSPGFTLRLKEFQKMISQYSISHIKTVTTKKVSNDGYFKKENLVVKNISKTKGKYKAYVAVCVDITWYMQIQDPPLVLDLGTDKSDKSRYRPFTVSGPHIDYVLWPAMCLHSNGPLVAKGVAQFKKDSETEQANSNSNEKPSETHTNTDQTVNKDLAMV